MCRVELTRSLEASERKRITMKTNRCFLSVTLLTMSLTLMVNSLSSRQRQGVENRGASAAASEPTRDPKKNANGACAPGALAAPTVESMETIVGCMLQASIYNQNHFRFYTVTREYKLFGQEQDKARSRVIANVTFHPPDSKNYRIQGTEGSLIGERIVRLVLDRETALAKDGGASVVSQDNYNFQFLREEVASGQRCYVLQLLPKRKDKNLLRGTIWVDADTYLIRRTEGEPQKSPSWWLRNSHVVFVYAEVSGMWLPTSSEFKAKVRLFGWSTILAHDLSYSYSQLTAAGDAAGERPYARALNGSGFLSPPTTE